MVIETLKQQAATLFTQLADPKLKYGIGMSGSLPSTWPEQISQTPCYTIDADPRVKIYSGSEVPQALLDQLGSVAGPASKFDAYHYQHLSEIVVIHIPQDIHLDTPITLRSHLVDESHVQHVLVIADKGSSARIVDHQTSTAKTKYHSHIVEVIVGNGACISYGTVQDLSLVTYQFCRKEGQVHERAALGWQEAHLGTSQGKMTSHTALVGDKAYTRTHSMYFGLGTQKLDIKTTVDHRAPHTKSLLLSRGVLADQSAAAHQGFITIGKGMPHCDGYQKKEALLLSDDARIDTIPVLEISNDLVKCAHGATISTVPEDHLFYLMSRGLSKTDATQTIVQGFFGPVIDSLDESTREYVADLIATRVATIGGRS